MACTFTYLGHSAVLLEAAGQALVIDPYLSENPVATMKPKDLKVNYIVLTHGHEDHLGDTLAIAKANGAPVFAPFEVHQYLTKKGLKSSEKTAGNPGGKIDAPFGFVAFTPAIHSSSYEGQYMGVACGVVVRIGDATIYHCGDTALFSDMKLIGELYKPDVACVPIGDRFTMGPEHGAIAAEWIGAKVAVPVHYKTWPMLTQDVTRFKPKGVEVRELAVGESMRIDPGLRLV